MKRVVVELRDERGRESVVVSDPMEEAEADAERQRIEQEHASAGDTNRWIRVGGSSVQSKHVFAIRVEEPPQAGFFYGDEDDEPFFRRDMKF